MTNKQFIQGWNDFLDMKGCVSIDNNRPCDLGLPCTREEECIKFWGDEYLKQIGM